MDAAEIVIREVQRDGGFQVRQLLAESVRQPRESANRHTHRQVLAFYKASRDVVRIGPSVNDLGGPGGPFKPGFGLSGAVRWTKFSRPIAKRTAGFPEPPTRIFIISASHGFITSSE